MNIRSLFLRTTYWINDFFKGSPIRKPYNDIKKIQENVEEGEVLRVQYLRNLLTYATLYSPFYSRYKGAQLSDFPVLNKSLILEHYNEISVDKKDIPEQEGEVFIQSTSGSTGTPFSIPQDTRKRRRRIAELKYFGAFSGFKSHDKLLHLRTWNRWQSKTKLQAFRENIIPFNIAQINDDRLKELLNIINKNKVKAIRGYASSIDLLANYAVEKGVDMPSVKLMIAGSEALLDTTRELVNSHFKANIISQYANEENGILAQESVNEGGLFHLNHASYIFEVLKLDEDVPADSGEIGRIVITDLFNFAFPLIRYDTGDTAQLDDSIPNTYPKFSKLLGRRVDIVYDTKGNIVLSIGFSRILKHYSVIKQWQFIQEGEKDYRLKLIIKENLFKQEQEILSQLKDLFGKDANIKIEFTDDIPILKSGKRKPVINLWKK